MDNSVVSVKYFLRKIQSITHIHRWYCAPSHRVRWMAFLV